MKPAKDESERSVAAPPGSEEFAPGERLAPEPAAGYAAQPVAAEEAARVEGYAGEDERLAAGDEWIEDDPLADERPARGEASALGKFYRYLTTSPAAEKAFRAVGVFCALSAAALLWFGRTDSAFVVAALGVVSWFLGLRNRLRRQGIEPGRRRSRREETEDET